MNITLIIGNGFDLNLCLPTSYGHFYSYYLLEKTERIIQKELKENLSDWADLEKQLGIVSLKYNNFQNYIDDIDHVADKLTDYLTEANRIEIPELAQFSQIVYSDLCDFTRYLDTPQKNNMDQFITAIPDSDEINLNVLTFNYTSVFERILEFWSQKPQMGKIKEFHIHHIHQQLDESGILLGVNDTSQINNSTFRDNYYVKAAIVKPFIYSSIQSGIDKACQEAIQKAHIIILFGTSLGETDQCWWDFIGNSLLGSTKRLIYCPFDNEHITQSRKILIQNRKFSDYVVQRLRHSPSEQDSIRPKIIPLRKRQLFHFPLPPERLQQNHDKIIRRVLYDLPNNAF